MPPGLSADGYEIQFGTNHLCHALLTKELLVLLEQRASQETEGKGKAGDARIVILESCLAGMNSDHNRFFHYENVFLAIVSLSVNSWVDGKHGFTDDRVIR